MTGETIWIEGVRIVLRDIGQEDLDVLSYWLRPEQRWQELDGPLYDQPGPRDIARILDDRRALIASTNRPRPRTYLSITEIDTGVMLGQVTWSGVVDETGLNIVVYNPDLWGYGLGYEAFGLWCEHLFQELPDLPRLDLRTWSGNAGMVRLAQKLGFVEQSRDRKGRKGRKGRKRTVVSGRRFDGLRFGLDRGEWERRFPGGFAPSLEGEQ